jgi:hypothetical protein
MQTFAAIHILKISPKCLLVISQHTLWGDARFGPVLLGSIFQMATDHAPDTFRHFVWVKICTLTTVVNSPEISSFWILRHKTNPIMQDISQRCKECHHSKGRLRIYRRATLPDQRSELLIPSGWDGIELADLSFRKCRK